MKKISTIFILSLIIPIMFSSCNNKKYNLKWEGDKLVIEMPNPTASSVGFKTEMDWHGIELAEIPKDVYNKLKKEDNRNRAELVVRFIREDYDQYGNSSSKNKDYSLGYFNISEVKKYKDVNFFNSKYRINKKIEDIVWKPYRDIESGRRKPIHQLGNISIYSTEED